MAKHWTQTAKGKRILAARKRAREAGNGKEEEGSSPIQDNHLGYAVGFIDGWLTQYADRIGVPARPFAERVGRILHTKARR